MQKGKDIRRQFGCGNWNDIGFYIGVLSGSVGFFMILWDCLLQAGEL